MMKLIQLENLFLFFPFERPMGNSLLSFKGKHANLIKVVTSDGIAGYGEAYGNSEILYPAFRELFEELKGFSFEIWDDLSSKVIGCVQGKVSAFHQGAILSAINLAFWDIRGKMENKPVCRLLGHQPKERIRIYGTGLFYREVSDYKEQLPLFMEELQGFIDKNCSGVKIKAGKYPADQELWLISQIRKEMPHHMTLMVDANCGVKSMAEAKKLAAGLQEIGVLWLEEPFHPENYGDYDNLVKDVGIRIAAGENEFTEQGMTRLLETGVRIIQPELSLFGGFSQIPKLIETAERYGAQLTPHVWGSGFLYGANLQFYSMLGEAHSLPFEVPFVNDPLRDICVQQISLNNWYLDTPKGPGHGVEINEKEIKKYMWNA
jgi:D-galactarolactone cycloisomerase